MRVVLLCDRLARAWHSCPVTFRCFTIRKWLWLLLMMRNLPTRLPETCGFYLPTCFNVIVNCWLDYYYPFIFKKVLSCPCTVENFLRASGLNSVPLWDVRSGWSATAANLTNSTTSLSILSDSHCFYFELLFCLSFLRYRCPLFPSLFLSFTLSVFLSFSILPLDWAK